MSQLSTLIVLVLTFSFSESLSTIHDAVPNSKHFISCLRFNSNDHLSRLVYTPDNSSFLPIWQVAINNLRFNKSSTPKPSIIVTPHNESQIQTTLLCTKKHGYQIRIRCGGHDFEALSSSASVPFVMLDLNNMRSVDVDVANRTAWVQGGAVLGEVYYAISQKTNTLYFPAGLCPTVGVGGYLSGGGYGPLMRKYGLGADNVVDVRFMDVNGNILDRKSMGEDLFWAIRGGRASSFGIVLAWKLRLVPVPELVTFFLVNKTLEEGATNIFHKYQYVMPTIDRNLLIRVQISSENTKHVKKKTIRMLFYGIYQGTIDTLLPLMDEKFPELNVTREICEEMRMVQASLVFAGYPSNTSTEVLASRSSVQKLNSKNKLDYVRKPIPKSGLKKIWRKMFENDISEFVLVHPFGGKMDEYSDIATPYPHRAGVLYQFHQMVTFYDQTSDTTPVSLQRINWLRSFNEFITPYVSKNPREAYLNYNDLDLGVGSATYKEASVWGERYFKRHNFKKLIRIKVKVDPHNFFKYLQSIPVF
ncbi:tetrahydroberberine oxidase-like [Rutidosis leptorrhynchoides]|uniref:tetrahydroberberine oxidase-like n=1 Tax=Rutidosis leptorrhynchoides TaxID=125765 RepID=UPI003A9A1B7A